MSKAYLNALYEEGSRQEIFEWLCRLDKENDELRGKIKEQQRFHGERVELRERTNT